MVLTLVLNLVSGLNLVVGVVEPVRVVGVDGVIGVVGVVEPVRVLGVVGVVVVVGMVGLVLGKKL